MRGKTFGKTFGITHLGHVRSRNEDRRLIKSYGDDALLLVVADGLGGGVRGAQAAEITIAALDQMTIDDGFIFRSLNDAVQAADSKIRHLVSQNEDLEGMGSTVTAVLVRDKRAHWINVGDSRLYRLRSNSLKQITTDQNMAQFLVEEGLITMDEARWHPSRNQLDQCVGCGDCRPDGGRFFVRADDLLILSTDGLHGDIPRDIFSDLVKADTDLAAKGRTLVEKALNTGGSDNMTLVMGQF